ncbi:MAG TPA: hypothetical protein VHD90_23215 [Phototrophicaceae bacterium]|nr:hypothetical protein [Phototrophicaceae bacterium]
MNRLKFTRKRLGVLIALGLGLGCGALFLDFAILPVLAPFDSVEIPQSCIENAAQGKSSLPADLDYAIPGDGTGTLLTSDANAAVVVKSDDSQPSFPSTVFLINRASEQIVGTWQFGNDAIAAALNDGELYLFQNNLGSFVDESSGAPVKYIVKADNYRQLYSSGDTQQMQTSIEISALHADGTITSHLRLQFRTMAYGCILS